MNALFVFISIIVILLDVCNSTCNYVYHNVTDTAWATGVCLYNLAKNDYMIYECPLTTDTNQNTLYISYYSDSSCSTQTERYDLVEYINGTFAIAYDCSGFNGCYINYLNNCDDEDNKFNIYSPVDTCVPRLDGTTSFKYECDVDDFYKIEYSNNDCSTELIRSSSVTACDSVSVGTNTYQWQFYECSAEPTIAPSLPSISPTTPSRSPTASPTVKKPVFFNKTIDEIIDEIGNKSNSNSLRYCLSLFIVTITMIVMY